ncbi:MAG: flagellar filament capping protein FliD, partial [Planctomycetota bacterium]|nr:flagellar filament capping protein FliD [Planctomycetota bacterium]
TVLGFGDLFDQLLDGLTNSIDGTMTLADEFLQDQIDLTNSRIDAFDVRLDAHRARLERQFVAMETALAQLQAMNNALLSLSGNLALAQSLAVRRR